MPVWLFIVKKSLANAGNGSTLDFDTPPMKPTGAGRWLSRALSRFTNLVINFYAKGSQLLRNKTILFLATGKLQRWFPGTTKDSSSNDNLSKRLLWFNCRKTLLRRGHHAAMYSCCSNSLLNYFQVQSPFLSFFCIDW